MIPIFPSTKWFKSLKQTINNKTTIQKYNKTVSQYLGREAPGYLARVHYFVTKILHQAHRFRGNETTTEVLCCIPARS